MEKSFRFSLIMAGCVVLIVTGGVPAGDWPQWRGTNRDGKVIGFEAPSQWPERLTEKWKVTVGDGHSTPALVGKRLYVFARQGNEEVLMCLNAADCKELWRDKYRAAEVTGPARHHAGPRCSPAVAGILSCLDSADGKVLWRKDTSPGVVPMFFTSSSPIIVDGMAIAHLGGTGNGAIIAYDLATGGEEWRWTEDGPEHGSPVLLTVGGDRQVVTLTDKGVVGIGAADGKLRWRLPFAPSRRATTPIVAGQTVILTGRNRGTKAVNIVKQGDVFAANDLWSSELATEFSTPVLNNGLLFGLSYRGNLFCIDAETGKTAWTDDARYDRFGSLLDAGSVILVLSTNAQLVAFKPTGAEYVELARIKVASTPVYAHPVVSGNRIFVKDAGAVTLWTVGP